MHLDFVRKLSLTIQSTNISAQKIDNTILETYGIVIVVLLMIN